MLLWAKLLSTYNLLKSTKALITSLTNKLSDRVASRDATDSLIVVVAIHKDGGVNETQMDDSM